MAKTTQTPVNIEQETMKEIFGALEEQASADIMELLQQAASLRKVSEKAEKEEKEIIKKITERKQKLDDEKARYSQVLSGLANN
jgi:beta-N-acetylglucosaminidase